MSAGSNSQSSSSRPLSGAERKDAFNSGISSYASLAPEYFNTTPGVTTTGRGGLKTTTPDSYTLKIPEYNTPGYTSAGPAAQAGYTSSGQAVQSGPAAQAANANAGAFQAATITDPGSALQLVGGDYNRLEQNILASRMAPLQQAMAAQYQMTDQEMADRGIYASGIGSQAKERIFTRDYLPQINSAAADSVAQRYGLESGDNNATNSFNLGRANTLNTANLQQSSNQNAFNTSAAERANTVALANAAATNQSNQFNAAATNTVALANAAATNQSNQFNAAATNQSNQFNSGGQTAADAAAAQAEYDAEWRPLEYAQGLYNGTGGSVTSSSGSGWSI